MLWLDSLLRDLKYGLRMVRSAKLISIGVVLTLAIGIGINTGIFTLINGMLLRPRTDSDPATFARLYAQYWSRGNPREFFGQFSPAAYRAIQERSQSLQELAAWRTDAVIMGDDPSGLKTGPTRLLALEVSCNFFSVYGLTQPLSGRLFRDNECAPKSEQQVAVLAEEAWHDRFASDPHIVGKTILLNRQPFTVIGITPENFSGRLRSPGIWVPLTLQHLLTGNADIFAAEQTPSLWLEGRLLPGHTRDQLAAETNVIVTRLPSSDPDLKERVVVTNGAMIEDPIVRANSFWILLLIFSGAALLLLVSCSSGAVLLLSRAVARQQEIAVRISLGAARRRIVRQLLSENLLLAIVAGGLGIYVALQIPKVFRMLIPTMPHFPFTVDWHTLGYLIVVTLGAAVVAGIAPALECLKQNVWVSLKGQQATLQMAKLRWSLRDLLVIVQVCFCVVPMVVSAMFSQAVLLLFAMEPGFETRHILSVPIQLWQQQYGTSEVEAFYQTLQERVSRIGQVVEVASSSRSPLAGEPGIPSEGAEFHLPTQTAAEARPAAVSEVSQNYFSVLGIPLLRGEGFLSTESESSTAIVSQSFASAFWPRQDPIGRIVLSSDGKRLVVIGVVPDNHTGYTNELDGPTLYTQRAKAARGDLLLLRFRGEVDPVASAVNRIVHDLDPQALVLSSTLRSQMDDNAEVGWLIGKMLLFIALVAASLALFGIYGVVGYSVTRRTREFGIRTALGATPRDVMRLVFTSGVKPVIAGIVVGIMCAFVFSAGTVRALENAPLPLKPTSPVPYGAVATSLILAALVAMIGHARRAAKIQPLVALREE